MRQLQIGDRTLTDEDCFVIAEIGANYANGPDEPRQVHIERCERMIIEAARAGVNAVKMQKRDNSAMFTKTMLNSPYQNDNSCGHTYGEHREFLDWFGGIEFQRFKNVAEDNGLIFFATPFDLESALFLRALGVPLWKIASCDVTNHELVKTVASFNQPMIISTGGAKAIEIQMLANLIDRINENYALLHCVSLYPNDDEDLHLREIIALKALYKDRLIGFSSHHSGIEPLIIARTLGAAIFEVHFTLNRGFRGTDHGFSMEPQGLKKICDDLPRVRAMLGDYSNRDMERERAGFIAKMGKGIYLNKPLPAGHVIGPVDITIKSPAGGFKPYELDTVVGRELVADCSTGVTLSKEWLK